MDGEVVVKIGEMKLQTHLDEIRWVPRPMDLARLGVSAFPLLPSPSDEISPSFFMFSEE